MIETISDPTRIFLIDQDGVMADFDGEVVRRMTERHPDVRQLESAAANPQFYTALNYPEEVRDMVWGISNEAGFIEDLPLVPGVQEGWERLRSAGFLLRVCTAPLPEKYMPTCRAEKTAWLTRHFGRVVAEQAIFTTRKHEQEGVGLLDDKQEIAKARNARWHHVIFDRPCNRGDMRQLRVLGWDDPDLVEKAHEARRRALDRR